MFEAVERTANVKIRRGVDKSNREGNLSQLTIIK
jgi:hypothetical protein